MGYRQLGRMIFCSSPSIRHFHVYFFGINFQLRESSLSKEDYHKFLKFTKSSPDASDGRDYQQFMFLHDWKARPPPPPPNFREFGDHLKSRDYLRSWDHLRCLTGGPLRHLDSLI